MSIELKDVFFTYEDPKRESSRMALAGISLAFEDHCFSALIGKTGSGKSTLIQQLNALLVPTYGTVKIDDLVIDMSVEFKKKKKDGHYVDVIDHRKMKKKHKKKIKDIKSLRKKVGLVFQFPEAQLFETDVLSDVAYGPRNFSYSKEESEVMAKEALTLVGIDSSYYQRSPFELSGGEKRRVAIAGILALKPDVLILDEPTVGLDRKGEDNLMELLEKIHERGTTIILSTHDMDVVLEHCDRAIVMNQGKIQDILSPVELFQRDDILAEASLEAPKAFAMARRLKEKGFDINLEEVKDVESLALEIKRVKGEKIS